MNARAVSLFFIAAVATATVAGCASGPKFDSTAPGTVRPGFTTKKEVRSRFGEPRSVTMVPQNGNWVERWGYETRSGKAPLVVSDLSLYFTNDVVSSVHFESYRF